VWPLGRTVMSMIGVVVVPDGVVVVLVDRVVVVLLGRLVDRALVDDGALVVVTRGVVDELCGFVDVRSDERAALSWVPREVAASVVPELLVSAADSDADADFAFAGAGAWPCGNISASTGTAVSPPIHSSTSPGNGRQLPAARRCRPSSRV
jgi:hypothetical protein